LSVMEWNRTPKASLVTLIERVRARQGIGPSVMGGPRTWSKDELINELADLYYPRKIMEEAQAIRWLDEGVELDPEAWGDVLARIGR